METFVGVIIIAFHQKNWFKAWKRSTAVLLKALGNVFFLYSGIENLTEVIVILLSDLLHFFKSYSNVLIIFLSSCIINSFSLLKLKLSNNITSFLG